MNDLFEKARRIARRLSEAGYEAYFAGGCVRDLLLGRDPADVDIATSARPEEVQRLFRRTIGVGKQFGVIIVVEEGQPFDVATFRSDGAYGDGRHPDDIEFTNAEEDVKRRDFTINGLLMDPADDSVIDYIGGREDLERGVVRTIGDPEERFDEDRLRILRAVRFSTRFDFAMAPETEAVIRRQASRAADPSAERVRGELEKILTEGDAGGGLRRLDRLDLLDVVLPEVAAGRGRPLAARLGDESSVLARTQRVLDGTRGTRLGPETAWALLLDDLEDAPPRARGAAAGEVLLRLKASRALIDRVTFLVTLRDRLLFARRISEARRRLTAAHPGLESLQAFRKAERVAARDADVTLAETVVGEAQELPPPLLRGDEVIATGVPRGPGLGRALRLVRYRQLAGEFTRPDDARAWLQRRYGPAS